MWIEMKRDNNIEVVKELANINTVKQKWVKPVLKSLSLSATLAGESATSNDAMSRSGS